MKKWKTLESKISFESKWFKIRQDKVQLPNNKVLDDYYVWLQGDIALVVPITSNNEFVLVRQYKHAVGTTMIEYPAGFVGDQEMPEDAARRELLEETGYNSDEFSLLTVFSESPTKVVGKTYVFLARNVRQEAQQELDENEEIEVMVEPCENVLKMVLQGKIWATPSVAATFIALEKLELKK